MAAARRHRVREGRRGRARRPRRNRHRLFYRWRRGAHARTDGYHFSSPDEEGKAILYTTMGRRHRAVYETPAPQGPRLANELGVSSISRATCSPAPRGIPCVLPDLDTEASGLAFEVLADSTSRSSHLGNTLILAGRTPTRPVRPDRQRRRTTSLPAALRTYSWMDPLHTLHPVSVPGGERHGVRPGCLAVADRTAGQIITSRSSRPDHRQPPRGRVRPAALLPAGCASLRRYVPVHLARMDTRRRTTRTARSGSPDAPTSSPGYRGTHSPTLTSPYP